MFNLWTLEWNVQSFENGTLYWSQRYWDAPIFFPAKDSFAMSEAQPVLAFLAPVVWLTGSTIAAYNAYILVSLTLNGWFARRLLLNQNLPRWIATLGGIGMLLLPVIHWQLGVAQLVPVWGIIWGWDVVLRWCRADEPPEQPVSEIASAGFFSKGLREGAELGCAWSMTFAMSVHHGLFAAVMFGVALLTLLLMSVWSLSMLKRIIYANVISAVVVGVVIGPMLWRHHRVNRENGFEREASLVEQLSVWPSQYLTTYGHSISNWLVGQGWNSQMGWTIGAGLLTTAVALFGVMAGIVSRRYRRVTILLFIVSAVAFVLSMGTHLSVGGWSAWDGLVKYVPGFSQVRSAYRFIYFLQIAVVLLAAIGIQLLAGTKRNARWFIAFVVGLLCMMDPWPSVSKLGTAAATGNGDSKTWPEVLKGLPDGGVVILPLLDGGSVHDYELVAEWMLQSMTARKPLVNGYSGFFPKPQLELAKRLYTHGIGVATVEELRSIGVRYIVVSPFNSLRFDYRQAGLELIESLPGNWFVLRIP